MKVKLRYVSGFVTKGRMRYYFRRGKFCARILGEPGSPEFMTRYSELLRFTSGGKHIDEKQLRQRWSTIISNMICSARARSRQAGREFSITRATVVDLLEKQRLTCAVSGIAFDLSESTTARRPFAPSLDRIDSAKGYTPDNIRIVCTLANFAMNDWGEAPVRRFAAALLQPPARSSELTQTTSGPPCLNRSGPERQRL